MLNKKQLFGLNLLCTFAYFAGAYAGRLLALPPNGATPIWPAAGIALAALLLGGKKVLPGLFLGSLFAQTFSFFDGSSTETLTNSCITGIVVSIGSCLQALSAVWLINRFVGKQDLLIKDVRIIRFLLLGGPVACVVTATVGTAMLGAIHAISATDLWSNWLTWWIGDTMGVLVFTPLLLIFFAKPRAIWQSRRNCVAYPLLMLLVLVVIIFHYTKQEEEQWIKAVFNQQTSLLDNNLSHELNTHLTINKELKSFFDNSQVVTPEEFRQFTKTLLNLHSSVQALEWIPRISDQQRANFEKLWERPVLIRELGAHNKMVRAAQRPEYFPITFVEPLQDNEERALGFDIATNPVALQALLKAGSSGQTTVTAKLKLIQDLEKTQGIVIYSPVYDKSQTSATQSDKKQALQGFVASVLRIDKEVQEVMSEIPDLQLLVKISDQNTVLYSDFPAKPPHKLTNLGLYKQSAIKLADRTWQVAYLPSADFMNQHQSWERWWLLCSCLLFTSLTSMNLLMLTGRTLRTEELVKMRTQALRKEVARREDNSQIFHALAVSQPLSEVLALIMRLAKHEDPEIHAAIWLLDQDSLHLSHAASTDLPDSYISAINELSLGNTANLADRLAFLARPILVTETTADPYWQSFFSLTQQAGLAACWSEPIISSESQLLGMLVIYYPQLKTLAAAELHKIEEFAQIAGLAIEKNRAEQRIRHLAFYDTLTQLPNRRLLNDRLNQELAGITRHNGYGALMFLDLDHFKTLNDSLGHHIGDELLIQVASRLKECVRDKDTVARLGGDEFVVLQTAALSSSLEHATDCALTIANRIQAALYIPYSLQGYEHHVTSSIGITLFSKDNLDIDTLFRQADTAMYVAKNKGRNTFSFYNAEMQNHADQRLELERDLIIALNSQQFKLHYQPQYDATGRIVSAEALLRWEHPEKGLIATDDFLPACEETGLILAIGEWGLKSACQQLKNWPMLNYIAVNIGSRQFQQPGFVQQVSAVLAEYQLSAHSLMLELTEQSILKDSAASLEKLAALQKIGVGIAIDNFGVGYSSVAHLKNLPINQIKIDQKFIHDIGDTGSSTVIVETMIMIAKQLKLNMVAEGVETAEQLAFLQRMGCNVYQGYYFSKPLAAEQFSLLLAQKTAAAQ